MSKPQEPRFFNRELSWLEFNQRVLDEARNEDNPLLERIKFLAITASNMDEFYKVRVGGLQMLRDGNSTHVDAAGMTVTQQLDAIYRRSREMYNDQYACLEAVETGLASHGIRRLKADRLTDSQRRTIEENFLNEFVSVLTPMAIAPDQELPHLTGGVLHLCVRLRHDAFATIQPVDDEVDSDAERFAIIALSDVLPRIVSLPSESGTHFILLEEAVALFVEHFFPQQEILECTPFRLTRNADMRVREDSAADLMSGMEEILQERIWSDCVRLEVDSAASQSMREKLQSSFGTDDYETVLIPGPLDLSEFMSLSSLHGYEHLRVEGWSVQASPDLDPSESLFKTLGQRNVLLYHPYESFEPVVRLISEAADDPDVLAIKQTLYRTSKKSPIVAALCRAAEKGKNVTALVELKARFDEQRNIEWARRMESAGVHVIHGVKGLKTHAKVCVVVRREPQGIQRYCHFGTGNYNESTARLYSDASYLTADDDLGDDAIAFFNSISGFSQPRNLRKLKAAPASLREKLLELIDIEIQRKEDGMQASISAKVNSLVDPTLIEALYRASQAGVDIELNVRGICCLRPGIPGLSENIRVTSIVDRYLEHARILHFHHGGDDLVFISSADWMQRNLDKRVELLVPVEDKAAGQRLIQILKIQAKDNVKGRRLMSDGSYTKLGDKGRGKAIHSQYELYQLAKTRSEQHQRERLTEFEPHQGPT